MFGPYPSVSRKRELRAKTTQFYRSTSLGRIFNRSQSQCLLRTFGFLGVFKALCICLITRKIVFIRGSTDLKTLYLNCDAGASGDMLLAAMLDLLDCENVPLAWMTEVIGLLQLEPGGRLELKKVVRKGVRARKIDFFVGAEHADFHYRVRSLSSILAMLAEEGFRGRLKASSCALSRQIFNIIGESEAVAHGTTVGEVHLHEVGAFDSIMDIAGFAAAFSILSVDRVVCSPVTFGAGTVDTAHGTLNIPTPAVAGIVSAYSIPSSNLPAKGECLTPTGAAILAAIVDDWGERPDYKGAVTVGRGAGNRNPTERANILEAFYGDA